jgi:uncharacterized protein DUF4340
MSTTRTTAAVCGIALALVALTWATAPRVRMPSVFADRGERVFPQLTDPNAAASLEVIEFDERSATVRPFKVQNRNGRWTIPSQHDYPADARDRLAQTTAAIIALRKDDVASDHAADAERCGVLDPLDTTLPSVKGRGTRLTVRGQQGQVLADIIIGSTVEGHTGFRYVRQPGQNRIYISNVGDLKTSTAFGDWIDRDLLQVTTEEVDAINLRNYSLDRSARRINPGEVILLQKRGAGEWTIDGDPANAPLKPAVVDQLLTRLDDLSIVGVLPKPAGITATLSTETSSAALSASDRSDLAGKGFYLAPDGRLLSSQGEIVIRTVRGVFYTLRFGEIAPPDAAPAQAGTPGENRYLFIMVDFDPQSASTPGRASEGADKVKLLRSRFAPWYYVIAADSLTQIRVRRRDLVGRG